jgi:hypothetical protein
MIFITTFTKEIYDICGRQLIESFIATGNSELHKLYIFFEDENDLYTEYYPDWLVQWSDYDSIVIANIMNYSIDGIKPIDFVDSNLKDKITFVDEYSSPRSVKWFRPVVAIHYIANILQDGIFSSIDADCLFTSKVEDSFFEKMLDNYNIAFLGRENFKIMRHGGYDEYGNYVLTRTVDATDKDTHTETGFLAFDLNKKGTHEFIERNFNYWISGDVLNLKFKTDCHTFDATRKELNLDYNNLCESMGSLSPIGSRVIESSILGEFLTHNKGTIGPLLYQRNLLK